MKDENIVLKMRNIHKSFPGVRALQGVDFTLREGEIHALMGENGAGKSTLIKVLTGVYTKDEGEIFLKGTEKAVVIRSPQDAQKIGISTVYQEITLCPNLDGGTDRNDVEIDVVAHQLFGVKADHTVFDDLCGGTQSLKALQV